MNDNVKIIRTSTVSISLRYLLKGQLAFLSKYFKIIAVSCNSDGMLDEVKSIEGVDVKAIRMKRKISLFRDIFSLIELYNYFRIEKPTIVHSITPKAGLLSMTAAYFARVPIRMHTFTGLIFPYKKGILKWILLGMDRLLCLFATNIYPEGEGVKHDLLTNKVTNKGLKILGNGNINGIDVSYYNPNSYSNDDKNEFRRRLQIDFSDIVFIYVGRMVTDKGINELISAFKKLSLEYTNIKLLLVGSFEQHLNPIELTSYNEILENPSIKFVGFQNDIRPFYSISDVLVFPSYREGFPNVVLQAGAMCLPSIVTDISGSNEIILNLFNGIVIPPRNSGQLYESMKFMIDNSDMRNILSANCRMHIISRYEQKALWEEILDEYLFLSSNIIRKVK